MEELDLIGNRHVVILRPAIERLPPKVLCRADARELLELVDQVRLVVVSGGRCKSGPIDDRYLTTNIFRGKSA